MGVEMGIAKEIRIKVLNSAALLTILLGLATAAHANIRVKPSSVSFGSQAVGSTSASQTVTITNENRGSVTISSVASSAAQFSFSGPNLPVTLEPGQSLTGAVTFRPSAAQSYSGELKITRANRSAISISLSGTGTSSGQSSGGTPPVAPAISSQPASVKIAAGQTATFNVAATGTAPLQFQWKKNGTAISGASSSTYVTPPAAMSDNNDQFTAEVSNSGGNATSNPAVLTVTSTTVAPSIATQPASQSVIAGNTASFSVAATGTAPLSYQWSKSGTPIPNATSSSYTTPAETTTDNNAKFTVAVSNSAGSATSNAATLSVTAATLLLNSSASSVGFGSVNLSSSGTQTVTLTNAGNSNVSISNVTISGAGFNASGVSSGQILTPGQKVTLTATFTPSAAGSASGSVSVASTASNSPDSISLSGTGVAAVSHSVSLSWTASTSTVVGYNTYTSQTSGGPYTRMNSSPVTGTSYTDSNVTAGQTYFFVVTSVNSNNVESADSAQTTAVIP
ncbi:MAG TPA: choice-of-anchor D domain-containing protein [Verrucomicrobiae bacterium]|nr:choice-of-anchor D domain-containing protein [Verrucomicrobiae bacterium]